MDQTRRTKGFSLIELLVVISIIALLMGILLTTLRRARKQARAVVCQAKLRQWGQILETNRAENDGRLGVDGSNLWGAEIGKDFLFPSPKYGELFLCPEATKPTPPSPYAFNLRRTAFEAWVGSTNPLLAASDPSDSFDLIGSFGFFHMHASQTHCCWKCRNPLKWVFSNGLSRFPVVSDSREAIFQPLGGSAQVAPPALTENGSGGADDVCIDRHNGGVNTTFADGSVRKVGLKELWTLKWAPHFDTANKWTLAGGVQPEDWPEWMRGFKDY